MPERRQPPIRRDAGSARTERLNAAIDQMLAGDTTPRLDDPDLRELARLAARLRAELPEDMPDPAFRAGLRDQLTGGAPVVRRRTAAPPPAQARFPWVAAFGAIAAVMVAAVAVGALGVWLGTSGSGGVSDIARAPADLGTATLAVATTGVDSATGRIALTATASANNPLVSATSPALRTTTQETATSDVARTVTPAPTESAPSTLTVRPEPTFAATEGPALAAVPPVDDQHVEHGPIPASGGGGGSPSDDVTYVLDTSLPDLADEADIFRLAPPALEPETFVRDVAGALGLEGEITREDNPRQTSYHLFGEGGSFHWTPATGAFALQLADDGGQGGLTVEQVAAASRAWLADIGYPVEQLSESYVALPMEGEGESWRLETVYAALPEVGIGHLLGVTLFVNGDGHVTEATGYWLDVVAVERVQLRWEGEVWALVAEGEGIWTGGGIVTDGGEFRADEMLVTYVLTRDPNESGSLVLQPVVETRGEFTTPEGGSARISCFIQAARTSR